MILSDNFCIDTQKKPTTIRKLARSPLNTLRDWQAKYVYTTCTAFRSAESFEHVLGSRERQINVWL